MHQRRGRFDKLCHRSDKEGQSLDFLGGAVTDAGSNLAVPNDILSEVKIDEALLGL